VQIVAGDESACALTAGGDVCCWGSNVGGGLGVPAAALPFSIDPVTIPLTSPMVKLSVKDAGFIALSSMGEVWYWGLTLTGDREDPSPRRAEGIERAIDIISGSALGCALLADHSIRCFGRRVDNRPPEVPRPAFEDKATWVNAPLFELTPMDEGEQP
jgi:hypothetical protein